MHIAIDIIFLHDVIRQIYNQKRYRPITLSYNVSEGMHTRYDIEASFCLSESVVEA